MLAKIDGEYRGIIAESPVIREKLEIMTKAANTDSTVLLLGEGGTGKEFFAEKIHQSSSRYDKPFVKQSCAEKSGKTIEIKKAGGGTLFFDEIGDLSAALQADLLKIIRKGGDYRILAATRIDIEKQAEKGAFCRDLYHRLNVFIICIPPLRQRGEDIPALADIFLKKSMAETKNSFKGFSRRAMDAMRSYSWPGNVRELQNSIERACIMGNGKWIEAEDLFPKLFLNGESRNLKAAENMFRISFIKKVLEENKMNQTEAAKAMGIQRTYLSRLIKELDISSSRKE